MISNFTYIWFSDFVAGHVDFLYPLELEGEDREKGASRRWKQLLQKSLNPMSSPKTKQ